MVGLISEICNIFLRLLWGFKKIWYNAFRTAGDGMQRFILYIALQSEYATQKADFCWISGFGFHWTKYAWEYGSQKGSMETEVNLHFLTCRIRICAGTNFWNKNFQNSYKVFINKSIWIEKLVTLLENEHSCSWLSFQTIILHLSSLTLRDLKSKVFLKLNYLLKREYS